MPPFNPFQRKKTLVGKKYGDAQYYDEQMKTRSLRSHKARDFVKVVSCAQKGVMHMRAHLDVSTRLML